MARLATWYMCTLMASLLYIGCIVNGYAHPPRLIVQVVVDQLRGDLLFRHQKQFSPDGFNNLLQHGVVYTNAHHPQANTVTCAGHANIATGAYPALHGIVSNTWYDTTQKKAVYCTEDAANALLPNRFTKNTLPGQSPRQLIASTFSDELVLAQKGRAFAVSLKDRAAIMLAGHAGKAFWYDKQGLGFVSSRYYYLAYPKWVTDWNQHYQPASYTWTLSREALSYPSKSAPRFKHRFPEFGFDFPHATGEPNTASYVKYLSMTPMADELTLDFAQTLLKQERLGQIKGKTDYLAISFSALDAIGHQFGPNSLEHEDELLRLDAMVAKLLKTIDEQVGLAHAVVVLTADHGVDDAYAYLDAHHMPQYPLINEALLKAKIESTLKQHHLPAKALTAIEWPFIYLDDALLTQSDTSAPRVMASIATAIETLPSVYRTYPLLHTHQGFIGEKVNKTRFLHRTGALMVVLKPYARLAGKHEARVGHGSPWNDNSHVPLIIMAPKATHRVIEEQTFTTDIAPTLSALLNIKAPSSSVGRILDLYGKRDIIRAR